MDLLLQDRAAAGRQLATALRKYRKHRDVMVVAIAPGGVPVAAEIAQSLEVPLDVIVARVLRLPSENGLVFGSVATGGARALDWGHVSGVDVSDETIERVCATEGAEVERLTRLYRGDRLPPEMSGRRVILVDEGVDSGVTLHGAAAAVRALHPAKLVLAVPVARFDVVRKLYGAVDEVVCLGTPYPFENIARWYWFFPDVTAESVRETLQRMWFSEDERSAAAPRTRPPLLPRTPGVVKKIELDTLDKRPIAPSA